MSHRQRARKTRQRHAHAAGVKGNRPGTKGHQTASMQSRCRG